MSHCSESIHTSRFIVRVQYLVVTSTVTQILNIGSVSLVFIGQLINPIFLISFF